jgi:threonine 3-dehydrogenase
MKALVKRKAEPGLWLEEVPVPEVGDDDVLIRIKKTSICGTDVHIYNWDAWSQKTIPVRWSWVTNSSAWSSALDRG